MQTSATPVVLVCAIAALWACSCPAPAAEPGGWEVVRPAIWQPERWQAARCNDGTAASMAVDRTGSKLWVIRLAGGFYCDERELMCGKRPRALTTALFEGGRAIPHGERIAAPHEGLFSRAEQNPLRQANQADLQYCSSDVWLGRSDERQPFAGNAQGWYFSGRKILRADLEALKELGMDPADPEVRIVLVGQSSGAVGLASNLDLLQELLPEAVAAGRVAAIFDGGWIPEVPMQDPFRLNRWGDWLASCEARLSAAGADPDRCLFGPSWLVDWQAAGVDLLVVQSGADLTQLRARRITDAAGRLEHREATRQSLEAVPRVVSGGWSYHVIAFDPRVDSSEFGAILREEVRRLLDKEEPRRVFHRYEEPP